MHAFAERGEDRLGRQDMAADGVCEGFQKGRGFAHPIGKGRSVEVETFAVEDLAMAVERQVIGIFADQDMGQQTRPWATALDRARRQRRLNEAFAAGAGQPGSDDPVHDEAAGHVFQFFGDILADPAQAATAIRARLDARGQLDLHPGNVVRDRTALRLILLFDVRQLHPRRHGSGGDLAGLERQLQLFCCLGRGPEPVCSVPGQLVPQLLDQDRLRLYLGQEPRGEAAQLLGVFGQGQGLIEHARSLSHCIPCGNH
jgi:hypothetical protein